MSRLFHRLLTRRFYRAHVILFVFLFIGAFGAVKATSLRSYHAALMRMFLDNPLLLSALLLAWTMYFARIAQAGRRLLRSPEGSFLFELRLWPLKRQGMLLLQPVLAMSAPVLLYALLFTRYAFRHDAAVAATVILLFALLAPALILRHWLRIINVLPPMKTRIRQWKRQPLSFVFWPLRQLLRTQGRTLLLGKAASLVLLYIPLVWNADRFDHDSLPLFLVGMVAANAFLAPQLVHFIEGPARFYRNLPLRGASIALLLYTSYLLLLLPELLYIFYAGERLLNTPLLFGVAMAAPHTLFLLAAICYGSRKGTQDAWTALAGLSFVSLFFFNKEAYALWDALQLGMGLMLFAAHYRRYEGN